MAVSIVLLGEYCMAKRSKRMAYIAIHTTLVCIFFYVFISIFPLPLVTKLLYTTAVALLNVGLFGSGYVFQDWRQRRSFTAKKRASDDISTHQQRRIEVDLPFTDAYDLALQAVELLDNLVLPQPENSVVAKKMTDVLGRKQKLTIKEADAAMGTITANLKLQLLGITDPVEFSQIRIRLQKIDATTTALDIQSEGRWFGEDYDMGRNLHYVQQLARYIRENSHYTSAIDHLSEQNTVIDEYPQQATKQQSKFG